MAIRPSQGHDDLAAEPRSVELRDYAQVVRRRWVLIAFITLLSIVLGAAYSLQKGPTYAATSEVVVEPATQGPLNPPAQPNLAVNMVTEQAVAESAPVAILAAQHMPSSVAGAVAAGKLSSHLTVTVPLQSNVLQISWQAGSPQAAQRGANAFANAYLAYRHQMLASQISSLTATLNTQASSLQHQITSVVARLNSVPPNGTQHQTLEAELGQLNGRQTKVSDTLASLPEYNVTGGNVIRAALPLKSSGLSRSVILTLAALIGLLLGMVAAFVRDALDDRLRDTAVLERKLAAPALAILPSPGGSSKRHQRIGGDDLSTVSRPNSAAADAFRALRSMLTSVAAGGGLSSIVVVGVDNSVSASQVAAELGVALAESGRKTLLIAADIRSSSLPQIFGLPQAAGLTNVLVGSAEPTIVIQRPKSAGGVTLPSTVAGQLSIISTGPLIAQPLSVLDSVAMGRLLKSLRDGYDFVVLDSPPADAVSDFLALGRLVDGVVVVASEARSKGRAADALRQRLERIGGHLAGGVLLTRKRGLHRHGPSERGQADLSSSDFAARQVDGLRTDRGASGNGDLAGGSPRDAHDAVYEGPQRLARRPS
jgi:Mrp family chromosome partitioning ATPase/capsular polysaccharide biosynthesis protein